MHSLKKTGKTIAVIALGILATTTSAKGQTPFLSNLHATAGDPVYTTYAAPMQRSQFIIDEGYQLNYDIDDHGIDLDTDHAGTWGLAFKKDGEVRYLLNSMFSAPVITASYSDLVKYHYEPFEGIEVDIFFDVYSSDMAIQDIQVTNNTGSTASLDIYPFIKYDRGLDSVAVDDHHHYLSFRHKEPADGWTTGHGIPHEPILGDVFMISDSADAVGAYASSGTPPEPSSSQAKVNREHNSVQVPSLNYAVEYGTVTLSDGTSCTQAPPQAQQIITLNNSDSEILTDQAPKWGDSDPNIPGNGWQGAELGNFQPPDLQTGDTFSVLFTCNGEVGLGTGEITDLPSGGIRTDIQLSKVNAPQRPTNLQVDFAQNGSAASLSWEGDTSSTFDIYRRSDEVKGHYNKVAEVQGQLSYMDFGLNSDKTYDYIIVSYNDQGVTGGHSNEAGKDSGNLFFSDLNHERLGGVTDTKDTHQVVALQRHWQLGAGEQQQLRVIRGVASPDQPVSELASKAQDLMDVDLDQVLADAEQTYSNIPELQFDDPDKALLYWNAFSLMRQNMMPPEGSANTNYYVFSREPSWGWGHGGQVFHESLMMLAYVFMDPASARGSQRIFMDHQKDNGYIDYRSGPYLNEEIPTNGQLTSSAPWFNWENWEIYKQDPDAGFLQDAYNAGKKFYNFWIHNRDADNDGLCEWGAHAVLESVRDAQVAVWDQVGWPTNFEALDLNTMLVREAQSLAHEAQALGDTAAARKWRDEAQSRAERIRNTFWDDDTGFFYMVDRDDHDFTFNQANDLKRKEIIGFLPLWAEVANQQQSEKLLQHLTNSEEFWRQYGIPSLSADDSYYNAKGYWNGPAWVQWNYLIFDGLRRYGYDQRADGVAEKMYTSVIGGLKRDHTFWEFYSPDDAWGGYHQAYIWTGIVARMMLDQAGVSVSIDKEEPSERPHKYRLEANYPNPFNPSTQIRYELPEAAHVKITVYDAMGRKIRTLVDKRQTFGRHSVTFNAHNLSSGLYFYRLESRDWNSTQKMLLIK